MKLLVEDTEVGRSRAVPIIIVSKLANLKLDISYIAVP